MQDKGQSYPAVLRPNGSYDATMSHRDAWQKVMSKWSLVLGLKNHYVIDLTVVVSLLMIIPKWEYDNCQYPMCSSSISKIMHTRIREYEIVWFNLMIYINGRDFYSPYKEIC